MLSYIKGRCSHKSYKYEDHKKRQMCVTIIYIKSFKQDHNLASFSSKLYFSDNIPLKARFILQVVVHLYPSVAAFCVLIVSRK